jgi:putative hydrolase of the HAD superfamily
MPAAAYLIDLYDTLVFGEWAAWRAELAAITGLTEDAIATAYHRTRPQRNEGAYETSEEDVGALLKAGGMTDPSEGLVRSVIDAEATFGDRVRLYDDALLSLAAIRGAGRRTALVSNCSKGTRQVVERLGLAAAVDAVVLSCEIGSRKPDPTIYHVALGAIGAQPHDAVFVDDQTPYCDGARALGIDTRLIVRPTAAPAEGFAPSTNGHRVIQALTDLL